MMEGCRRVRQVSHHDEPCKIMTSVYRPKHSVINPEADTCRMTPVDRRTRAGMRGGDDGASEWAGRRKAQPAQVILPATRHWMSSLPPDYRPQSLAIRFPRIANMLAASWHNPKECTEYICSLLNDERGGRRGFPPEVQKDLADLRIYCAALHPIINWDENAPPGRR